MSRVVLLRTNPSRRVTRALWDKTACPTDFWISFLFSLVFLITSFSSANKASSAEQAREDVVERETKYLTVIGGSPLMPRPREPELYCTGNSAGSLA